ncbi:MAG: Rrf2 family transcriptional regulator [Methylobacteriaceae bacterium]|nr:Rrf2 family transcriptional regulator [Methylobacteriaceae bacterium]
MNLLSRRSLLAIAAVVDVALHARPHPAAAKALAARHNLPPRHLETLLQTLVRSGILKGVRGPRGGYELARERRRITAGDIVRAAMSEADPEEPRDAAPHSALVLEVIGPMVGEASAAYLAVLDAVTVDDLCQRADERGVFAAKPVLESFTI